MKKQIFLLSMLAIAYFGFPETSSVSSNTPSTVYRNYHDKIIGNAFENQRNDLQVTGQGIVIRILPDDERGSRHQRFILQLASGQTLLIAHNIQLAPRIDKLSKGNKIEFKGEYEWSYKGGIVHWTHHDPLKRHADGWLKHNGRIYQ